MDMLYSWEDDGAAEHVSYDDGLRRFEEQVGGQTFAYNYDPANPERLMSKIGTGTNPARELMLGYDAGARVTTLDWAPFASVDVGLGYGPLGHLTEKSVTNVGTYRYWYDHDMRLVKQVYPSGTLRRIRYLGGRDPMVDEMGHTKKWEHIYLGGEPVAQVSTDSSGSALRLLITDRMGRVRKLTNTSGTSLVRYVWDAWGDTNGSYKVIDASESPMPEYGWGLPGQRGTGNGVTLNGWRAYVPEIGRYTSPEPLHMSAAVSFAGPQAYSYAAARPLVFVDPDGRNAIPVPWIPPIELPPISIPAPPSFPPVPLFPPLPYPGEADLTPVDPAVPAPGDEVLPGEEEMCMERARPRKRPQDPCGPMFTWCLENTPRRRGGSYLIHPLVSITEHRTPTA